MDDEYVNPHAAELSRERFALLQSTKAVFAEKINASLPYEDNGALVSEYCRVMRVMDEVLLEEAKYLVALEEAPRKRV